MTLLILGSKRGRRVRGFAGTWVRVYAGKRVHVRAWSQMYSPMGAAHAMKMTLPTTMWRMPRERLLIESLSRGEWSGRNFAGRTAKMMKCSMTMEKRKNGWRTGGGGSVEGGAGV